MSDSLKAKATRGVLWSALDRFLAQGSQIVFNVILARILMPEDFGLVGMLSIFIVISQSFVDSGMGSGLIQKKDRTDLDFSTVFIFNAAVSLVIYLILFLSSPLIADFFEKQELVLLTRILGLSIIINSLSIVQRSILSISLDFKTFAKINSISIIISGIIAVALAYSDWGVWSLVIQNLLMAIISVILFWTFSKWKFSLKFSVESFKNLFSYGSKLLIASLYANTFSEIYNVSIGKIYTAQSLGFYTNAKKFSDSASSTITSVLQQVTFPILSSLKDDREKLISVYVRLIRITAFFVVPLMSLFALLADPLIRLLLTDKWESAIPLLQWLCIARIVTPISVVNMNILNAVGRSDLFLKVDLSKLPIIIIALVVTIPLGIKAIVIGSVATSFISFFINAYMPGKLFGYGALAQLRDMSKIILATLFMILVVIFVLNIFDNLVVKLIASIFAGIFSYLFFSKILKIEGLKEIELVFLKF